MLSYVVLFVGTVLVGALLIDTSVLEQTLQRPVHFTDYLTLAWITSSLATVGGAIGSGLENEETVRAAAYGYHPEPDGWRDEKAGNPTAGGKRAVEPARSRLVLTARAGQPLGMMVAQVREESLAQVAAQVPGAGAVGS